MESSAWGSPVDGVVVRQTGVGAPATLFDLLTLSYQPAGLVQIGIAGAYPDTGLDIGDVVLVASDRFVDLGMELPHPPHFLPLADTPFGNETSARFPLTLPDVLISRMRVVNAGTVNACTGTDASGLLRRELFNVEVETMEGAAGAVAARYHKCPMVQLRAISNRAGDRSIDLAGIRMAMASLTQWLGRHRSELLAGLAPTGSGGT